MSHGVIDLGDLSSGSRPRTGVAARRWPVPYRTLLAGLSVLLAALLGGAAHRGPPAPPAVIAAWLSDGMLVDDERVFVVSRAGQIVTGYALPDGRRLHRTVIGAPATVLSVVQAGSTLLVSSQVDRSGGEETVAMTAGTDRVLWRRPSRLLAVSRADGLVLLRENSAQAGGADWQGVDLATGAVRWTVRQPARGLTTVAPYPGEFPRWLVTATDRGDVEVRDVVTGAVTTRAKVPIPVRPVGADVPVWLADGLLLVGNTGGTTAYTLPGLVRRWRSPEKLSGRWVQSDCAGAVCALDWSGGLRVLDSATGALLWNDDRWNHVREVGGYLMAGNDSGSDLRRRLAVVDPRTGRVRGDFGRWQTLGVPRAGGTVLGVRTQSPGDLVRYALLDPRKLTIRMLGVAAPVTGDCHATSHALVCRRIDASIGIWRLG